MPRLNPEPRRWGLRTRLLVPIFVLVAMLTTSMAILQGLSVRAQVNLMVDQRARAVLEGITERVQERQRSKHVFAQLLADETGLAIATESADKIALTRILVPLQTKLELGRITIYAEDGRELLYLGARQTGVPDEPLVASALAGLTQSTATVSDQGLAILASAPIKGAKGIVGTITVAATLGDDALQEIKEADAVELATFHDGKLVNTTSRQPDLIRLLSESNLTLTEIAQLNPALERFDLHASGRSLSEEGLLLALVPIGDLKQAERERGAIGWIGASALAVALLALGLTLGRDISRSLNSIVVAAAEMRRGQYHQRVPPSPIRELDDLATAVNHLAQALENQHAENARLFGTLQRRAEEAETLRQAGAVVAATLQPQQAIERILEQLARVVPYDSASVQLLHRVDVQDGASASADGAGATTDYLEIVGGRGWADPAAVIGLRFPVPGDNPNSVVIQQRQPHILGNAPAVHVPFRETPHSHIQSWLGVPLILHDRVIGMLAVDNKQADYFTPDHARLVSAFADQVAIALENARLFEETRLRAHRQEALYRVSTALAHLHSPRELCQAVVREVRDALGYPYLGIFLVEPETGDRVLHAQSGWEDAPPDWRIPPGAGLSEQALLTGELHYTPDVTRTPRYIPGLPASRSEVDVPIMLDKSVLGVLVVEDKQVNAFDADDFAVFKAVASQLAIALENVRLFASVERQVAQLATLREIDRALSSILDLAPMLETMLSRLAQVLPYDSAVILLLEENVLRAVAARGREQSTLSRFRLDISNNAIFQEMARTQAPVSIGDLVKNPDWVDVAGEEFARAWLGAPLVARGAIIGQIGLFSATPHAFTREHGDLLRAFANHAAIAIANARLRAELHEQARRDSLTQVLNHGTFIAELRAAGAQAQACGESLALIMLDLDNFKQYNDTYGHVVGDQVLMLTVQAIRAHVKQSDFVGRWGGEEFAVALRGADLARAARVATRIRATLAETTIRDRHARLIPPPTASQGIAALPESTRDVDDLIEQADRALYRAKSRGKDQVALAE